jgi:Fic family protein
MSDFKRDLPYNNLPDLPPEADMESRAVLKKAIRAHKALAKLVGSCKLLPNQSMLINTIGLQEAKLSSEIENIVTTNDELYQAFSSDKIVTDAAVKEILHYQEALWQGYNFVKEKGFLSTNLFIKIFNIIKETNDSVRKTTGTKILNTATGEIIYTPPEGEEVIRKKLKNLEDYMNTADDDTDILIKMAVMHYQFEAIHPFSDGNGRTGRILNILFLVMHDLLELPVLYLSKYIIENKPAYYNNLNQVTEKEQWENWVLFILNAVEETALYTQQKIDAILLLMKETEKLLKKKTPEIYSKELLEIIFSQPYCKRKYLEDAGIVKKKTAGLYLTRLEEIGLMKSIKVGKEKMYIHRQLYEVLKK